MSIKGLVENILTDWLRSQLETDGAAEGGAPPAEGPPPDQEKPERRTGEGRGPGPAHISRGRRLLARLNDAGNKAASLAPVPWVRRLLAWAGVFASLVLGLNFLVGEALQAGNVWGLVSIGVCGLGMGLDAPGFATQRGVWVFCRSLGGVALMLAALAVGNQAAPDIGPQNYYWLYLLTAVLAMASLIIHLAEDSGSASSSRTEKDYPPRVSNYLAFLSLSALLVAIGSSVEGQNVLPGFMGNLGAVSSLVMCIYFALSVRKGEISWRLSRALPGFIGLFGMLIAVFTLLFPSLIPIDNRQLKIHFIPVVKEFVKEPNLTIEDALDRAKDILKCGGAVEGEKGKGVLSIDGDGWFRISGKVSMLEMMDCIGIAFTIRPKNSSEVWDSLLDGCREINFIIIRRETAASNDFNLKTYQVRSEIRSLLSNSSKSDMYINITEIIKEKISSDNFPNSYQYKFKTEIR